MSRLHRLTAVICDDDWHWVEWNVLCPWDGDDLDRDCIVAGSDECGLVHWLDAAGAEGVRVVRPDGNSHPTPVYGTVTWDDDGPILTVVRR